MSAEHALPQEKRFFLTHKARPFLLVWIGQLVSVLGSGLSSFALGLWVYGKNGSVTQFALIALFAILPRIFLSPVAGMLVDRWDRRRTMLFSDLGAGLCTLAVALLLFAGRLDVWHIYLAAAASAAFGAFQYPAYAASVVTLVPRENLGRANGLIQLGQSLADIFAPLLAGMLIAAIGTWGVLAIDFTTFLFAVLSLMLVRFPQPVAAGEAEARLDRHAGHGAARGAAGGLLHEALAGWRFIASRPGLMGLLGFLILFKFLWGMVGALAQPMILGFASPAVLGGLLSVAGGGLLVGSLGMSAWGGPRRKVFGLLSFEFASGLCFLLMGLRPSVWMVALGALGAHCTIALIGGCSQVLWQSKTPLAVQGRVFAAQQMIGSAAVPLAFACAGPLAEQIFEPLLAGGGPLAASVGAVTGVGPGRGIALMFLVMGVLKIAVSAAGALFPRVRNLEAELPDAA